MTYSGDPASSPRDEARFWLQDTLSGDDEVFTDLEVDFAVALVTPIYGDQKMTAAYLADVAAARFAGEAQISADGVNVDLGGLVDKYRELSTRLRQMHAELNGMGGGPIDLSSLPEWLEVGLPPKVFGLRMMDNPAVGRQEYGSRAPEYEVPAGGYWTFP
jgi:hypothetical protein